MREFNKKIRLFRKTNKNVHRTVSVIGVVALIGWIIFLAGCDNPLQDIISKDLGPALPPEAPSDVEAKGVSVSQIDLTWTDNSDNEEEFQIQRKKSGSDNWQTETVGADSTTFSDKELDPETKYVYRVRAANSDGESEWTAEISATTLAPHTYTVTYDGNGADGGTVPVDGNEYVAGSTVTVLGNTGSLTKSAYAFVGWNTEPDGSGTDYSAGSTFNIGANNVTLYAQWSQNVHTITFDKNDPSATGTMADQDIPEGNTLPLSACGFIKSGWAFIGWSTTPGGSVEYADGANYTMGASDVTLYAQWSQNTHTLTFDKNDPAATGSMSDLNIDEGDTVALPTCGFTKTDWVFTGWSTTPGGSVQYSDEADYTMGSSDDTLYAQWDQTYTVTYVGNGSTGGDPPTDSNRYTEGDTVDVQGSNTLTKTGYNFEEWNTEADGTGTPRGAGSQFSMPAENVTLYAQWSVASFTVSYNGNDYDGGSVPAGGNYDYNETVTVANQGSMSRTGYTFTGWNTASNGSGTAYSGGDTFSMPAYNVTLFAQWEGDTHTISYNENGAYGGTIPSPQNVNYGTNVTVRDNTGNLHKTETPPSWAESDESFKFLGWNTQSDGNGAHYDAGSGSFTVTGDVTLYAEWGEYQLRDRGPAGGLIFYKKSYFSSGWRYLEAAPQSSEWTDKEWGAMNIDINGDNSFVAPELVGIGDGQDNTTQILAHVGSDDAAKLCDNLAINYNGITFDDWFLPSKDELNEMYEELQDQTTPVGGFSSAYYWSSSEVSHGYAWNQYMGNGYQDYDRKSLADRVRAVRGF